MNTTYSNSLGETMIVTDTTYTIVDADGTEIMSDDLFDGDIETFLAA